MYPLFLSDFNKFWILSTDFQKIFLMGNNIKIHQCKPSCSMQIDRQTDRGKTNKHDEANSRWWQFYGSALKTKVCILVFGPCIFIIEEKNNQKNAQINFGLINLLLFNHSNMFRPLNRSHHQGVQNPWELQAIVVIC